MKVSDLPLVERLSESSDLELKLVEMPLSAVTFVVPVLPPMTICP